MYKTWITLSVVVFIVIGASSAYAQGTAGADSCEPASYPLPGEFIVPESITYDAATNMFYVGSAANGTIFRGVVGDDKSIEVFSPAGTDERMGALGMKVDGKGRLFVAGSRGGQIYVYDTKTAKLIDKFDTISKTGVAASESGFPHNLTDIAITPDGDVFVTDAFLPYLYRVYEKDNGELDMEVFIDFTKTAVQYQTPVPLAQIRSMEDNVSGFNINSITATPDGKYLLIGQTNTGLLYRVTLEGPRIDAIDLGGKTLRADDLLLDGDVLYVNAIIDTAMGATTPTAIILVQMNDTYTAGEVLNTYTDERFKFQTSLVLVGECLLATNSQLPGFFTRQFELPFTVVSIKKSAITK
jgi:Cu-Zn family superoxide dismutase